MNPCFYKSIITLSKHKNKEGMLINYNPVRVQKRIFL